MSTGVVKKEPRYREAGHAGGGALSFRPRMGHGRESRRRNLLHRPSRGLAHHRLSWG